MRNVLAAVIVSTAFLQGCTTMPDKAQMSDSEQFVSYVGNSDGSVLTGGGDCLRSIGWSSKNMMVECQSSSKAVTSEKMSKPVQVARLSYNGKALFAFDSAELSSEGQHELTNLLSKVNSSSQVGGIVVVGHADSTGESEYNQWLSEQRAETVRQFLESGSRNLEVTTSGMGESAPVADNATAAGRRSNRRVEVKINAAESNAVFK